MHRSKFDIGGADAAAGGMSITSVRRYGRWQKSQTMTETAGLVFNECSGWGGTRRLDVGELLVCERPVDGFAWSPSGRALQADALWELVVVHDVLLQGSFPELLPAGPAAERLRAPVWWATQANRQGDGGPLGPHVVDKLQLLL